MSRTHFIRERIDRVTIYVDKDLKGPALAQMYSEGYRLVRVFPTTYGKKIIYDRLKIIGEKKVKKDGKKK